MEQPPAPDLSQTYASPPRSRIPIWVWPIACCGCAVFPVMILAAVVFPIFAQAREKARMTSCVSNEKQMALSIMMYSQDYDEKFPPAKMWVDVTMPYTKNEDLYRCPSVTRGLDKYGYAFNVTLDMLPMDKVQEPRRQRMLFDSTNLSKNATDSGVSLPTPGRHLQGNVTAYADGHAAWKKPASAENMPE